MLRKSLALALIFGCTCVSAFAQPPQTFLGKNAQTWLSELEKGNDSARRGAAFALGKLESGAALNALEKRLQNDKDFWVREAAAFALGEIGKSSTNDNLLPSLTTALAKDTSATVRRSAAFALGCLGADASPALPQLETALKDKEGLVRQSAAWALAKLGKPAVPALKLALGDADVLVKRDAATSMEPCIPFNNRDAAKGVVPLKVVEARELLPELVAMCREENSDVRRAALGVLIKLVNANDVKIIGDLNYALKDQDEEVKTYAALTLSNIGGKDAAKAVPQLIWALNQETDIAKRQQAAMGLYNIGPEAKDAVPHLIKALKYRDDKRDKEGNVRSSAALALAGIGKDAQMAYEALLRMAENTKEGPDIREGAAYALAQLGSCTAAEDSVERVLKVLGNTEEPINVRTRIMWALHVHYLDKLRGMGIYPTLYSVLKEPKTTGKDNNKMLRYDCAVLLGELQMADVQPDVMKTLLEFLRDANVEIHVGKSSSVGGVGKETGVGGTNVSESGKGDGRVLAARALAKIGYERLVDQPEIVAELRTLAGNNMTYEELRKIAADLLKKLKK